MTFLAPAAFGLLAVAPVVVLLYLLKQKRRSTGVPTLMFWRKIVSESKRHVLFRKLRQWLSLLVHLFILALLILAVAKPEWGSSVGETGATVLILDARARMQAAAETAGGQTRFQLAMEAAKRAARSVDPAHPAMLVVAAGSPSVACSLSADEQSLISAIESLQCTDSGGDLGEAIRLAESLIASQPGARQILVFSDESSEKFIKPESQTKLIWKPIGRPLDNVGITRLAARPLLNSPQTNEILLEISNFGQTAWEGDVELYFDDRLFDVRPFKLPVGESAAHVYPAAPTVNAFANTRGWLTAKLTSADALPLDNTAYAVLPSAKIRRVLLLSDGNLFLERLLAANPSWKFDILKPSSFAPDMATGFDAIIFDGTIPEGFDPNAQPGGYLFLNQHPFALSEEAMASPVVTGADKESPLLKLVRMDEVAFIKAKTWTLDSAKSANWRTSVVLQSAENPLVIAAESDNRSRFAAFAFHPLDTDLPMRVAFPLLIANTVNWLADRSDSLDSQRKAGTFALLPDGVRALDLPLTKLTPLTGQEEPWVSVGFEPEKNGFYYIKGKETDLWIGVNTDDARMSDLRQTGAGQIDAPDVPKTSKFTQLAAAVTLAASGQWPPWIYCAIAALVLLTLEWGWFHRRKTE